ncbi:MAG: sugar phosphate isomerase/epimerase [Planctomycetota bacterium]|nr:MAG: sugar phosphate isomerase/epimerase [Planctomycetota bacterium]
MECAPVYVSASTRCFADQTVFDACRRLDELEFDKYELWIDPDAGCHVDLRQMVAEPENMHSRLREQSRMVPVAISLAADVDDATFRGIARFAKLGRIAQVTVPAPRLGTPFNEAVDALRNYVALAGEEAVRVSIPTHQGTVCEDLHTAVELCDAVPGLGLTLDPSHFIFGRTEPASFDRLLPRVYHVHLRDTSPDALQVPVGLGNVDYSRLVSELQRSGYRWALSVDLIADAIPLGDRPLELRKLRLLLETLL